MISNCCSFIVLLFAHRLVLLVVVVAHWCLVYELLLLLSIDVAVVLHVFLLMVCVCVYLVLLLLLLNVLMLIGCYYGVCVGVPLLLLL